jgi:predicted site-specific integrase-resolvase
MRVAEAAETYQVNSRTIYGWLKQGVVDGNRNLILENNKLKKELEIAYRIIGRATAEMQKSKN